MSNGEIVMLGNDLMFGSKVEAMIRQAGFEPLLTGDPGEALARSASAKLLIVDLTDGSFDGTSTVADGTPTFGFYAHTDDETRRRALDAGFVKVVPRSRMMREGSDLIAAAAAS
ncbi:MAG: hypothetical protein ACPHCI_10560 [Solirubrobacterales bacterium]